MQTQDFNHLSYLLSAYFHQDWNLYGSSFEEVLNYYYKDHKDVDSESINETILEIDRLLGINLNDNEIGNFLKDLGVEYVPVVNESPWIEWIRSVRDYLIFLSKLMI